MDEVNQKCIFLIVLTRVLKHMFFARFVAFWGYLDTHTPLHRNMPQQQTMLPKDQETNWNIIKVGSLVPYKVPTDTPSAAWS